MGKPFISRNVRYSGGKWIVGFMRDSDTGNIFRVPAWSGTGGFGRNLRYLYLTTPGTQRADAQAAVRTQIEFVPWDYQSGINYVISSWGRVAGQSVVFANCGITRGVLDTSKYIGWKISAIRYNVDIFEPQPGAGVPTVRFVVEDSDYMPPLSTDWIDDDDGDFEDFESLPTGTGDVDFECDIVLGERLHLFAFFSKLALPTDPDTQPTYVSARFRVDMRGVLLTDPPE